MRRRRWRGAWKGRRSARGGRRSRSRWKMPGRPLIRERLFQDGLRLARYLDDFTPGVEAGVARPALDEQGAVVFARDPVAEDDGRAPERLQHGFYGDLIVEARRTQVAASYLG